MATLNFERAHTFLITGGIYSDARHVTMISGSADPQRIARDYFRHGRSPRSSRRRSRTPSPSSSESSFVSSNDSGQSTRSSPPTSVDGHEGSSSQSVPLASRERPDVPSPLSSRLGALTGFTTPVPLQTPVASRPTNFLSTSRSSDTVRPVIPRSNEVSTSARARGSPRLSRHPGVESTGDVGGRIRPQGPRRRRPLPPTPLFSQLVDPGTPADLFSITDSPSHIPGSSSQSSWGSFTQEPPHSFVRSSTVPPRPPQPMLSSRHIARADVLAPSLSYVFHNHPSRSSSSQVFSTSPIRESSVEPVISPSRRSVQSPPPIRPFQSIPLPSRSTPSRTSPSRRAFQSPPQNLPFQPIPLPPYSTPPHTSTASRSYVTSRSPRQAFSPSLTEQPYQSSAWSMDHSERNMSPPMLYHHPSQPQNSHNQDFIYMSSSGTPRQHLPRSPYFAAGFAYLSQHPYLSPLQSQQSSHEHSYEFYDGPSMSSPR